MRTTKAPTLVRLIIFISVAIFVVLRISLEDDATPSENALEPASETNGLRSPYSFFPKEKTKILLVGTWHFDFPGMDAKVTSEEDKIDVLSIKRQQEMRELLEHIKRFKPNKIAIEARAPWKATEKLRAYQTRELRLTRDERHQIGIKLADELRLDTLYAIDTEAVNSKLTELLPNFMAELWKDYDWRSEGPIAAQQKAFYAYTDSLRKESSLLDFLKYMNSPEYQSLDYGLYLTGDFKLGEYRGADVLAVYWYNRNLRIFRNIQEITEGPKDHIMVLMGNGHASILRQLVEFSPQYELVEFSDL